MGALGVQAVSPVDYVLLGLMLTFCVRWPNRR